MAYLTQTDLLQRITTAQLTQLTDDANVGSPNATVVSGVLDEASGKVDGYCRGRYATPLQTSAEVTAIARDIAVYLLWSRRPNKMSDEVRQRYEDAVALLKDISTGKATLDQPTGAPPQSTTAGPVLPCHDGLRFKECDIKGFV
jgi:phage gp36-like protein